MGRKVWLLLLISIYFLFAYAMLDYFNTTCVFLKFIGIPCPGCGMTRAFISLINLDFIKAIKYNIVVFFMPYIFMYIFLDFKNKIHNIFLIIIAVIAIINWLIKIILYI